MSRHEAQSVEKLEQDVVVFSIQGSDLERLRWFADLHQEPLWSDMTQTSRCSAVAAKIVHLALNNPQELARKVAVCRQYLDAEGFKPIFNQQEEPE